MSLNSPNNFTKPPIPSKVPIPSSISSNASRTFASIQEDLLLSRKDMRILDKLNINDDDTKQCIIRSLKDPLKASSKEKLLVHLGKHKGVRRTEVKHVVHNDNVQVNKLPTAPITLQPKALHNKLQQLKNDPSYGEVLSKSIFDNKNEVNTIGKNKNINNASILKRNGNKLNRRLSVSFKDEAMVYKFNQQLANAARNRDAFEVGGATEKSL